MEKERGETEYDLTHGGAKLEGTGTGCPHQRLQSMTAWNAMI